MAVANLLVSSLSALSSMVQAYNASRLTNLSIEKAQQRLEQPLKQGGSRIAQVIDAQLLQALSDKAEQETKALIAELQEHDELHLLDAAIKQANERICFYLSKIKEYNKDVLPTKRLNELWASHGCDDVCKPAEK